MKESYCSHTLQVFFFFFAPSKSVCALSSSYCQLNTSICKTVTSTGCDHADFTSDYSNDAFAQCAIVHTKLQPSPWPVDRPGWPSKMASVPFGYHGVMRTACVGRYCEWMQTKVFVFTASGFLISAIAFDDVAVAIALTPPMIIPFMLFGGLLLNAE